MTGQGPISGTCKDSFRFTWTEFSGSLGDLGVFIPLVVGMTITCGLDIGVILILAGLMNIATGLLFRQPLPVQPMKALASVVITEGLTRDELTAAGIWMGALLLFFSFFIDHVLRLVPKAVVRGIQLGVGLKLALKGLSGMGNLSLTGFNSLFTSILVIGFLLIFLKRRQPVLLYIFFLGFLLQYLEFPGAFSPMVVTAPGFYIHWPSSSGWLPGLLKGALPQIPLTLLNSVVAVCALSADYFPGRGISLKRMAASVGFMNLVCVPLGGLPMCHGSGGLAAQYRFGARTGMSVVMLGVLKVFAGVLFGGMMLKLLQTYPMAVLSPMLIFAGIELAKASQDVFGNRSGAAVCLVTAGFILTVDTLAGFLVGCLMSVLIHILGRGGRKLDV